MSCMVCRKSDIRLFSVSKNYGTINHTVGDDLAEIYGEKISLHLAPDSVVCNVCMNMLDNMAMLRKNIWSIITNPCDQPQPGKFLKLWNIFASIKIEEDLKDELQRNQTLTPSKLLKHKYSVPYQSNEESHIAERERLRSMSRGTIASNTSEVSNILNGGTRGRKKRKGHNWTRPKRGRPKSVESRSGSRSTSELFSRSSKSRSPATKKQVTDNSRKSPARKKQIVEYDDQGRLTKKRTRSVSRAQEEEERREEIEANGFTCQEKDCTLYFEDLEVLNLHKIIDHKLLALYYCDECQQRYTTFQHLEIHSRIHDVFSFACLYCRCELENQRALQRHLDEHSVYSIRCKFCDTEFLSKYLREQHVKTAHREKRKRHVHRDKLIIARVDSRNSEKVNNKDRDDFRVEYMYHTDMEYEDDDIDVTVENLKLRNIDFYMAENERLVNYPEFSPASDPNLRLTDESEHQSADEPDLLLSDETDFNPADSPCSRPLQDHLQSTPLDDPESELVEDSFFGPTDDSELFTDYSPTPR
nr:zinc finger and BTB domain-containing protein 24-like [Leptinotarsa decemlineata]